MDFVLVQKGKAMGPFSTDRVRELIKTGEIPRGAKIWRAPWTEWTDVSTVFPLEFGLTADFVAQMEERGEIRHKPEEDLFERVSRQVPSSQIEDMLRRAKSVLENPLEVKITSRNKEELVYQNLQQAVSKGFVPRQDVEKLVQELTETGGQRIFLYRAKQSLNPAKLGMSLDEAGTSLLGKNWAATEFPIYHNLPATPQISSFRSYKLTPVRRGDPYGFPAAQADGWILSLDASVQVDERIDHNKKNGGITTQIYASKLEDAVVVLRYWERLHILELRIPNFQRRATVLDLRDLILHTFAGKLGILQKFEPWILANACTKSLRAVLHTPKNEPSLRRISGTLLRERDRSTMKIEIENSDQDGILDSKARRESVEAYLAQASTVESAVIFYQPPEEKDEIRVVVAADCPFELSVRKTISAWHLDHVIFRLFSNS